MGFNSGFKGLMWKFGLSVVFSRYLLGIAAGTMTAHVVPQFLHITAGICSASDLNKIFFHFLSIA